MEQPPLVQEEIELEEEDLGEVIKDKLYREGFTSVSVFKELATDMSELVGIYTNDN